MIVKYCIRVTAYAFIRMHLLLIRRRRFNGPSFPVPTALVSPNQCTYSLLWSVRLRVCGVTSHDFCCFACAYCLLGYAIVYKYTRLYVSWVRVILETGVIFSRAGICLLFLRIKQILLTPIIFLILTRPCFAWLARFRRVRWVEEVDLSAVLCPA